MRLWCMFNCLLIATNEKKFIHYVYVPSNSNTWHCISAVLQSHFHNYCPNIMPRDEYKLNWVETYYYLIFSPFFFLFSFLFLPKCVMAVLLLFDYILTRLAVYQIHNTTENRRKKTVLYFQELILLCCPSPGFMKVVVADRQQQHMQNNSDQSKSHQPNPLPHIYFCM